MLGEIVMLNQMLETTDVANDNRKSCRYFLNENYSILLVIDLRRYTDDTCPRDHRYVFPLRISNGNSLYRDQRNVSLKIVLRSLCVRTSFQGDAKQTTRWSFVPFDYSPLDVRQQYAQCSYPCVKFKGKENRSGSASRDTNA